MRWLVALISDTGMRLVEGAGLLKSDIQLEADVPYVRIQKHAWQNLKTDSSERTYLCVARHYGAQEEFLKRQKHHRMLFQDTIYGKRRKPIPPVLL